MTFDEWKTALLPLGWSDRGSHIVSPEASDGQHLIVVKRTIQFAGEAILVIANPQRPAMPPDLDTMQALLTGLQIPMTPTNTPGGQGESHE